MNPRRERLESDTAASIAADAEACTLDSMESGGAEEFHVETRTQRVVLETDRYRISGDLTLPREGYRSRLSDLLNRDNVEFIALVDAEITSVDGGEPNIRKFIAVARHHIQLAYEV
jgi:hypothetical protein